MDDLYEKLRNALKPGWFSRAKSWMVDRLMDLVDWFLSKEYIVVIMATVCIIAACIGIANACTNYQMNIYTMDVYVVDRLQANDHSDYALLVKDNRTNKEHLVKLTHLFRYPRISDNERTKIYLKCKPDSRIKMQYCRKDEDTIYMISAQEIQDVKGKQ